MTNWPFLPQKSDLIPNRFFEKSQKYAGSPAYWVQKEGQYHATSWADYGKEVEAIGRSLLAMGITPHQKIGIIGFNSPHWTGSFLAALSIGAVPVGLYGTSSKEDLSYIINHGELSLIFVENQGQLDKIAPLMAEISCFDQIILLPSAKAPAILQKLEDNEQDIDHGAILSWQAFLNKGSTIKAEKLHEHRNNIAPEDLATLIYTSGTTGKPKGVMLPHRAIATAGWSLDQMLNTSTEDSLLSYLPLSHIVEQIASMYGPVMNGYSVYFARALEKVADDLKIARPTLFVGVPRIWEKFYEGLNKKLAGASGVKKHILTFAQNSGRAYYAAKMEGNTPNLILKLRYALAEKLVFNKLRAALGLDRTRFMFSGSAPIKPEILTYFSGLGLLVCEVYGLSENAGPANFNLPDDFKISSVGKAVPGVGVKVAEDGEILIGGPINFSGYYKDDKATKETLKDGWLYSGDLGRIDDKGYVYITGRKKDIIITSGGKNIAPRKIEESLESHPLIEHAIVIGDRQRFLGALFALNQEELEKWAEVENCAIPDLSQPLPRTLLSQLDNHMRAVNKNLGSVEKVMAFKILSEPLTIENGALTPTLKVKRFEVIKRNQALINEIFGEE